MDLDWIVGVAITGPMHVEALQHHFVALHKKRCQILCEHALKEDVDVIVIVVASNGDFKLLLPGVLLHLIAQCHLPLLRQKQKHTDYSTNQRGGGEGSEGETDTKTHRHTQTHGQTHRQTHTDTTRHTYTHVPQP